jgi:manganese transport protein
MPDTFSLSAIGNASAGDWRRSRGDAALSDVHRSVAVPKGTWRRFAAFLGPGYMVAVGYMDPGNWATSLAGGSKFGYALLVVALVSNIMAIVLQSLCARLAIASGRDLAQACRDAFPRWVSYPLWALAEIAIIATDIAEVIGTAIGLNLLFGIPLELGVLITALDVFLILWLQKKGFRWLEAFIITLLGVIAVCFGIQIALADPDWGGVIRGFAPTVEIVKNPEMLYLALGILGATVMPHNLYLHSAIVQTRDYGDTLPEKREALRFATYDSTIALMFALLINASILILAAASFHATGRTEIAELGEAHQLLGPAPWPRRRPGSLCHRASLLRSELDRDRHTGRPGGDGGFFRNAPAAVAAPLGHPRDRHHSGSRSDGYLRQFRHRPASDPDAGRLVAATLVRRRAARDVHR